MNEKQTSPLVLVIVMVITVGLVIGGFIVFQTFTNPNKGKKGNGKDNPKPEDEDKSKDEEKTKEEAKANTGEKPDLKKTIEELKAIELRKQIGERAKEVAKDTFRNLLKPKDKPMQGGLPVLR